VSVVQATSIVLAMLCATAVVLARDPARQIVLSGFYGLILTALFFTFQAPDVALSMLVVGTVAFPLVVLTAIARVRNFQPEEEDEQ
jgi:energy-converting hydrogenase B subunit D